MKIFSDELKNTMNAKGEELKNNKGCLKTIKNVFVIGFTILCIITLIGMLTNKSNAERLKDSYLNNYPSMTVGDALDNVFTNSKWSDYEENGAQFVSYEANYNEHYVRVVFIVYDNDNFNTVGLYIDGYDYSYDIIEFMNTIYYNPQLLKDNNDVQNLY